MTAAGGSLLQKRAGGAAYSLMQLSDTMQSPTHTHTHTLINRDLSTVFTRIVCEFSWSASNMVVTN